MNNLKTGYLSKNNNSNSNGELPFLTMVIEGK